MQVLLVLCYGASRVSSINHSNDGHTLFFHWVYPRAGYLEEEVDFFYG